MDTVVVLAGGIWEDDAQARNLAAASDFTIAADGGFANAQRAGAHVDLVVGDLDSLGDENRVSPRFSQVEVRDYPEAKDASDLELALEEALSLSPRRILILGGLGRRIDHALTNIHLLERGLDARADVRLVDGQQSVAITDGRHDLEAACLGDRVSLIPLSPVVRASTSGLRYPLRDGRLVRASSRGVSNEVAALPASVSVHQGRLVIVHMRGAT